MCQRITCSACGKPTFAGCGRHVEAVLRDVPIEARCRCRDEAKSSAPGTGPGASGWLSSLFSGGVKRQP